MLIKINKNRRCKLNLHREKNSLVQWAGLLMYINHTTSH